MTTGDRREADERSDEALVDAVNRGDAAAFGALYERHRDWVVGIAQRFGADHDLALDVLQETFLTLLARFPGFRLTAALRTFLYPVAKHHTLAAHRKGRRARALGDHDGPAPILFRAEVDDPLRLAMDALGPDHREILLLRYVDDLALADIADALDLPVGTVKSRLHHAVRQLREDDRTKNLLDS
jgi:RNA polymerase sigma-70 factor (ECF subfamily)